MLKEVKSPTIAEQAKAEVNAEQAKAEVNAEHRTKSVATLKIKYRERLAAQTVLDNIDREIVDLEHVAEQGNIG